MCVVDHKNCQCIMDHRKNIYLIDLNRAKASNTQNFKHYGHQYIDRFQIYINQTTNILFWFV